MIGLGLRRSGRLKLGLRLGGVVRTIHNTLGTSDVWGSRISGFSALALALDEALRSREGGGLPVDLSRPVSVIVAEFDARLAALEQAAAITLASPLAASRSARVADVTGARARVDAIATAADANALATTTNTSRIAKLEIA